MTYFSKSAVIISCLILITLVIRKELFLFWKFNYINLINDICTKKNKAIFILLKQEIMLATLIFYWYVFSMDGYMSRYMNVWKKGYIEKYINKHLITLSSVCKNTEVCNFPWLDTWVHYNSPESFSTPNIMLHETEIGVRPLWDLGAQILA